MAYELPPEVYSPHLLESVIYDLEQYTDWYRQTRIQHKVGAAVASQPEPDHSAETELVIRNHFGSQTPTLETLEGLLAELRALKLPEIHVKLAAMPNHEQRRVLVSWFHTNISSRALISFVADRNLGGGIVIRTPNHVYDFTWKQQLMGGASKLAGIIHRV